LAAATIWNSIIYKNSIHMSRIPILNLELNKKTLVIIVENVSDFPATNLEIEMDVDEKSTKLSFSKFWKHVFNPFTGHIPYIPPWNRTYKSKVIDCRKYLFDKLGVKVKEVKGESIPTPINKKENKEFFIHIKATYYTDTMHRVPLPLYKKYNIKIKKRKVEIKELQ
jgi:hypothetical protein